MVKLNHDDQEFNRCVEEVNKLRTQLYKLDEEADNILQEKVSQ